MRFVMKIYDWQIKQGRYFLHEQPLGNMSWSLNMVKDIVNRIGVWTAHCDQCTFGQTTWDSYGEEAPARQRTGFTTNGWEIYNELNKQCTGEHEHQQLIGGRAKHCAAYPPKLVSAILRGFKKALVRVGLLHFFRDRSDGGRTMPCGSR